MAVVFGEGIGLLLTAAPQWTNERLGQLLGDPDGSGKHTEPERAWFSVVWSMAVTGYEPSPVLFAALRPWFDAHIEHLDAALPVDGGELNPRAVAVAVAHHVLMLYTIGQLDEDLQNPALISLFNRADSVLSRQALGDLGWRLRNAQGEVDGAVLDRLRALWDWRAEQVTNGHAEQQELLDFYWWVASERLEPAWWLPHLATIAGSPDFSPHEMIGAPLATAAREDPAQALTVFTLLYDTSRRTRPSSDLAQHAPAILKAALAAGPAIEAQARELASRMGRDGYTDLIDHISALPN